SGHVFGHVRVDFAGKLDKAGVIVQQLQLPRKVKGIDWNAMASEARTRIEGHEAERLRGRRIYDLPDLDSQLVAHDGDLIDESDIHRPEGVFQELYHLGALGRTDGNHALDHLLVEKFRQSGALGGDTPDDFRRVAGIPLRIPRIDSLGREGEIEVSAYLESIVAEFRQKDFVGGSGISRA